MTTEFSLLKKLFCIHSKSGREGKIRKFIWNWIKQNVPGAKIVCDKPGNLYVTKGKSETYPCIVAHMDQVQERHSKDFIAYEAEDIIIYPKELDFDLTDRRDYDSDEMELYFDFYDGIAIECDEDGSRVSFRPLIILYPTIEICETIPELKERIERYCGDAALDGMNYHDIALTFGKVHRQDAFQYYGDK